ncbi:MAG: hypothetical protein JNL90_14900 [Planctomycetes bacterium]|nr:hypothetical protein [Planctomycetota bacterium]
MDDRSAEVPASSLPDVEGPARRVARDVGALGHAVVGRIAGVGGRLGDRGRRVMAVDGAKLTVLRRRAGALVSSAPSTSLLLAVVAGALVAVGLWLLL